MKLMLEQFSFECRKVIGFAFTMLRDWRKRFAPLFHPIRSKTKTNIIVMRSHAFSCALRQLHVITLSFDWFTVLSVFSVADLGEGPGGPTPPPPLFGVKKEEMTEGKMADRASKSRLGPPLAQGLDPPLVLCD